MKALTLARHAQAEWQGAAPSDFERALTPRGFSEATSMARRLIGREALHPQRILVSPAVRALHTAQIFARELELPGSALVRIDALYLATPEVILAAIAGVPKEIERVMVVGHNPGVSELARQLAPDTVTAELGTAACCTLVVRQKSWDFSRVLAPRVTVSTPEDQTVPLL